MRGHGRYSMFDKVVNYENFINVTLLMIIFMCDFLRGYSALEEFKS